MEGRKKERCCHLKWAISQQVQLFHSLPVPQSWSNPSKCPEKALASSRTVQEGVIASLLPRSLATFLSEFVYLYNMWLWDTGVGAKVLGLKLAQASRSFFSQACLVSTHFICKIGLKLKQFILGSKWDHFKPM